MRYIKQYIFGTIATSLAIFCSGCNSKGKNDLKDCDNYQYSESISSNHVYGFVSDADGNALANVLVTSGKDTTLTKENGSYTFNQCRAVNGRCVVKFESNEYFSVIRTANIDEGDTRVDAILMPQDSKEGVTEITRFYNSQGATINVGKMAVEIPANSLVYESDGRAFNGSVYASTYYLNPNSENFAKEMPGGDMSGVTSNGKDVILLSYGMVEVTLKDSANQKLQLKDGAESTLTFPSPEGLAEHKQIPLWYFDEEKATWIEEGIATKNGEVYSGKVKHFSWHNLDYPFLRTSICGRVTNTNGKPVSGILVTISQTSAYTDSNGYYCAYVPCETPVFVTVKPLDYARYTNCPIYNIEGQPAETTFTQDIVLPTLPCIHGKVTNHEGRAMRGTVVCANSETTITRHNGEYNLYYSGNESVTLQVAGYANKEYKKYEFKDPSEIDEETSYDFVIDNPKHMWGRVLSTQNRYIFDPLFVTVIADGHEFKVNTKGSSSYSFQVSEDTKDIYAYVSANDGYGVESNKVKFDIQDSANYMSVMPNIYVPTGITVSGTIVNTCGPSKANVTIESGRLWNKESFSQMSKLGYFSIILPAKMKGDAKVKINCQGKRITKKIDIDKENIDLGTLEFCSGEKPEPDCIYAIIGEKTVKFNTKTDKYTEMFQKSNASDFKYQAWYKAPDYNATLVLEINKHVYDTDSKIKTNHVLNIYLLNNGEIAKSKSITVPTKKDNIYTFKTDCELITDNDTEDVYLYGSGDVEEKKISDNINMAYISSDIYYGSNKVLVGKNNSTKFYTLTVSKESTKWLENNLKSQGFKEHSTFMDDEQRISSIFLQDNAEALIHRNKNNTSDVTILVRDGIGTEPLYHCWKVDFSNSSLKNSKDGNINYMWKNEADIAQLAMFGPIMGIKFTKTDIKEQKCGCATSNGPVTY